MTNLALAQLYHILQHWACTRGGGSSVPHIVSQLVFEDYEEWLLSLLGIEGE